MISAMPAVAVRRERKKQRAAAAAHSNGSCSAGSRQGSLSSLPSPSTRSSSLLSTTPSPMSVPGNYYNYFARQNRRPSATPSAASSTAPTLPCGAPSRRPSASVSTISSAASNYVSALHKVRERQLDLYRERARFLVYTGSVLVASGATLIVIGLVAAATAAQTVGLLFVCLGLGMCVARVFCLVHREELPLVRRARTVSGQSIYVPSTAHPSAATTPDDSSTTSSYYFSAVPLQRIPQQQTSPLSPTAPPPLQPPPPPVVVPGVHGAVGSHRSNPSSLLTPMSLNSIPEMQVLITDDSQRY